MKIKKILHFILTSFKCTVDYIFKTVKFIIEYMFAILRLLNYYVKSEIFNFYSFSISFTLPSLIVFIITSKLNMFFIKTHQNELNQNNEIIEYISLFFEPFIFMNIITLLIIIIFFICLIKTNRIYMYFFQLN